MVDGGGCKMANPFHSTGSPIVDRMCRLQFTGNVIPAAWYRTITRDNGKPNLTAIIILSDVVYWYRPVEIRDELTGQLCGFRKKFKADILQRNYQQLADQFGISKREAVNAVVELEKIGVVRRVFRTVRKGGMAELKRAVSGAECRCPDTTDLSGKPVRCRVSLLKGRAVTIQRERCHIRM